MDFCKVKNTLYVTVSRVCLALQSPCFGSCHSLLVHWPCPVTVRSIMLTVGSLRHGASEVEL